MQRKLPPYHYVYFSYSLLKIEKFMRKILLVLLCVTLVGCGRNISLFNAAQNGNAETVRKLIALGADVNYQKKDGWTPLMTAAAEGHADAVKVLLENGAKPNAKSKSGRTALHFATQYGQEPVVKLLLDYGADPTAAIYPSFVKEREPKTPIETALHTFFTTQPKTDKEKKAAYNILKMFIYKTGQVYIQYEGYTPLMLANRYHDKTFSEYLTIQGAK